MKIRECGFIGIAAFVAAGAENGFILSAIHEATKMTAPFSDGTSLFGLIVMPMILGLVAFLMLWVTANDGKGTL